MKLNVMIIDSDQAELSEMERMLAPFEYLHLVGSFTDPNQAWATLDTYPVDIIFLDIDMEYISGLEIAARILELYAEAEIVLVTKNATYAVEAFNLNVMDYLLKPMKQIRLGQTISKLLRRVEKR